MNPNAKVSETANKNTGGALEGRNVQITSYGIALQTHSRQSRSLLLLVNVRDVTLLSLLHNNLRGAYITTLRTVLLAIK